MYKRILSISVVLLLAFMHMAACTVYGDVQPLIESGSAAGQPGDTVSVSLKASHMGSVSGGGFDVVYDADRLQPVSADVGKLLEGFAPVINLKYGGGRKIRVTWASIAAMKDEGTLLTLNFRIKDGCQTGKSDITIENVRLYDGNSALIASSVRAGTVTVKCVRLSLRTDISNSMVRLTADLSGDMYPSGGSLNIVYDSSRLEPVSAVTGTLLAGNSIVSNLGYSQNAVRISWAGTEAVAGPGELCSVYFRAKDGAAGTVQFAAADIRLYSSDSKRLYTFATDTEAELKSVSSSSGVVSVSNTAAEGKADVVLTVRPGSMICGGSLTVSYDISKLKLVEATAGSIIAGKSPAINDGFSQSSVRLSWADTLPLTDGGALLNLKFDILNGSSGFAAVSISDMKLYGEDTLILEAASEDGGVYIGKPELIVSRAECKDSDDATIFYLSCFNYASKASPSLTAIASLYDADNRMVAVRMLVVPGLEPGRSFDAQAEFRRADNVSSYRIIFVDDLNNLEPVMDKVEGRLTR